MRQTIQLLLAFSIVILLIRCGPGGHHKTAVPVQISDDSLMTLVQYRTFQYFWDGAEPNSGLARERYHADGIYPQDDKNVVTSGGSGFGVMAILVGIERGFITREEGLERMEKMIGFLEKADRFHGIYSHWIAGETGHVKPFSKKDNGADGVESAYLFQGLLTVRQYFRDGDERERELAGRIDKLWKEAEWDWFTRGGEHVLYWHWSPDYGWEMNFEVRGYNECLIYYVMAASSPTHPIAPEVYHEGWARSGGIDTTVVTYGHTLTLKHNGAYTYGGPLFWAHYSYLGLDPRGLKDKYADYWEQNISHTLINRQWCIENPNKYNGYGEDCWGLTSSYTLKEDGTVGYSGHQPAGDLGVIAPTAALSSIPYSPEYSLQAMRTFYEVYGDSLLGDYGFYDAFSPQYDWFPRRYLAIDQGPIVAMIENYRSGLLWGLFMSCPEVQAGLDALGFQYQTSR
jgi:hypothetical protein